MNLDCWGHVLSSIQIWVIFHWGESHIIFRQAVESFLFVLYIYFCVWAHAFVQRSENNLWELVLFFHHFLGIKLRSSDSGKCLNPLSHLAGPGLDFYVIKNVTGLLCTKIWHYIIQKVSDTAKRSKVKECDKIVSVLYSLKITRPLFSQVNNNTYSASFKSPMGFPKHLLKNKMSKIFFM